MTDATDLDLIEARIATLVDHHARVPDGGRVADACAPTMAAVTKQAIASSEGGKRLRALLALAAYDAAEGSANSHEAMLDLACAIEVFQTAALVHDDIIDESDLRRGKPSAHRAFASATGSASIGRGLGIMLGDLLATASVSIAVDAASRLSEPCGGAGIVPAFLTMHREVELGQVLDLAVEMTPLDDPAALADASLNVFRWKTASYTTIMPIELGLLAAGVETGQARRSALAVGTPLGIAFQLADDLLDVTGSSKTTGKPVGGDIREGKRTVLLADALGAADRGGRAELTDAFTAPERDEAQVRRVMDLFASTGAIAASRRRIAGLWDEARTAIDSMALTDAGKALLTGACARFIPDDARPR